MFSRFLKKLTAVILALGMLPVITYAEEVVSISDATALMTFLNSGTNSTNVVLTCNIDLSEVTSEESPLVPTGTFSGTFDGAGYTISGLYSTVGLFDEIGAGGIVKDLGLTGTVNGSTVGGFAKTNRGTISNVCAALTVYSSVKGGGIAASNIGTVENSSNCGSIFSQSTATALGGIVAENSGTVTLCKNEGSVTGSLYDTGQKANNTGGIAGKNTSGGTINKSLNQAVITGNSNVGGICGNNGAAIALCANHGEIRSDNAYGAGISGYSSSAISKCDNYGAVSSPKTHIGGICGNSDGGAITECTNHAAVQANNYTGGITGRIANASASNCGNYGEVTGAQNVGGIAGLAVSANMIGCINSGSVSGTSRAVGGIVGLADSGTMSIASCFNFQSINMTNATHNFIAGICALSNSDDLTVNNCGNVGAINGTNTAGGVVGGVKGSVSNSYTTTKNPVASNKVTSTNNYKFTSGTVAQLVEKLGAENWTAGEEYPIPTAVIGMPQGFAGTNAAGSDIDTEYQFDETVALNLYVTKESLGANAPFDIYPEFGDGVINLFLPSGANLSALTYKTVNVNGDILETKVVDLSDGKTETVKINNGDLIMTAYTSQLPTVYVDVTHGTFDEVNASADHSYTAYGDLVINVPQTIATERGWGTVYRSEEKDDTKLGTMEIRGRGNSSWNIDPLLKKSYQMKLEKKQSLLGMDSSKKWILLQDSVWLVGQKLGLDLGQDFGFKSTPSSEFVDAYVDGHFIGNMLLTEKVDVGKSGVNISDLDDEFEKNHNSTEGLDLTGGYLLEIDNFTGDELRVLTNGNIVSIKSPEDLDKAVTDSNAYAYIKGLITDLFDAVYGDGLMPDGSSYLDHIDIESFARYYWHQEFLENTDCGSGSTFMYKDKDSIDGTIYAGPIWDNDRILNYASTSGENKWVAKNVIRKDAYHAQADSFYNALLQRKDFASYVVWYYKHSDIKDIMASAADYIDEYYSYIAPSAEMDYLRWNPSAATNHFTLANATALKNRLETRAAWIDEHYEELVDLATKGEAIDIPSPPEPQSYTIARMSCGGGTASTEIGDAENGNYSVFTGIKAQNTSVKGSVTGSAPCKIEYSDSAYTWGDSSVSVPVIAADADNQWGDTPYFEITTNTLLYSNLTFSAKLGGSKKGVKNFALSYSTDGTNFTPLGTYTIKSNKQLEPAFENIALPKDAENQALLVLRIAATDRATIGGSTTDLSLTGGETAINDIVLCGETNAEIEIYAPTASKGNGSITEEQTVTLDTNTPDAQIYYTLSDGKTTTEATLYRSAFTPFDILPAQQLTLCAWTVFDGTESEKVYYTYQNGGQTIAAFKNSDWTSASTGRIYATGGKYPNAFLSASLDGTSVYPPLKDSKGFALAPDDGEKWKQNGGWCFEIPTSGFRDIRMTMDAASSSKGPKSFCLEYSTDGSDYTEIDTDHSLPVTNIASYYDFYEIPVPANTEKLYVRLSMREDAQASGATPLFDNLSKGNNYIDNIIFTGTKAAPLTPYIAKNTDTFGADDSFRIISPEDLPIKYSVAVNGEPVITDATYTDAIDASPYAGSSVTISAYCEDGGETSAVFSKTYTFKGAVISEFNFRDASHLFGTYATATYGSGKISCRPDGATAATMTYDSKYGLQTQANAALYWIYPDADWLLELSTKGYGDISISLDQRSGGSGPRDYALKYSLDGVNFTKISSSRVRVNSALNSTYLDFDLPAGMSDKETVYLSIYVNGKENVDGDELTDPTVIGKGKTSLNHVVVRGVELPSMITNVTVSDTVNTTIVNVTENAISPVVLLASYKKGRLVDLKAEKIVDLAQGAQTDVSFPNRDGEFDKRKIMVFDSLIRIKPLCKSVNISAQQ